MPAAPGAVHLGTLHAVTRVFRSFDRAGHRVIKTRPPSAALELGLHLEQGLSAAGADEGARTFFTQQRARPGRLGTVLAQNPVLLAGQELPPLRVRMLDR